MYYKMITTISLKDPSSYVVTSICVCVCVCVCVCGKSVKIYSSSNFQAYNTILLTIVNIMLSEIGQRMKNTISLTCGI